MGIGISLDTEILLWNGTSKPAKDVRVGDVLAGTNGPVRVEKISTREAECSVLSSVLFDRMCVGTDTVLPVVRYHCNNREPYTSYVTADRFKKDSKTSYKGIGLEISGAEFGNNKIAFDPFLLGWMAASRRRIDKHGNVMILIHYPEITQKIIRMLDEYKVKYDVRESKKSKRMKDEIIFYRDDSLIYSLALDANNYMFNYGSRLHKPKRREFLAGCICASYVKDGMIHAQAHAKTKKTSDTFVTIDNFLRASLTLGVKAWSRWVSTDRYYKKWINLTGNIDFLDIPEFLKLANRYSTGIPKLEIKSSAPVVEKIRDIIVEKDVYITSSGIKISSLREKPY